MQLETFNELGRVMNLMGKRKWLFILSCLVSSLSIASLPVINSLMYQKAIDGALDGEVGLLIQAGFLMLAAIIMICVVTPITSYSSMYLAKQAVCSARTESASRLFRQPAHLTSEGESGKILSRLTNDLGKAGSIFEGELYSVLQDSVIGLTTLTMSVILDWRLALIVAGLGIVTGVINTAYARPFKAISERIQELMGEATQRFLDIVAGNLVIKLSNIGNMVTGKFARSNSAISRQGIALAAKESEKDGLNCLLNGLTFLGVLSAGAYFVNKGSADLGAVFAVISLKPGVDDLFLKLGGSLASLQKSLAGTRRFFSFMDQPLESLPDSINLGPCEEFAVVLENISFNYGRGQVLKGLDMTVRKNQVTALVGRSGAGKSTLAKIITGALPPETGKITYSGDGEPSLDWIRNQFAWVSQDPFLFDCSIAENIGYGKPSATMAEIKEAAQAANAHEFIVSLPQGYETRVGEQGVKLSGGQRQRIAIARAIIKNAPILLLDEATSALDSQSEELIQQALKKLMAGRTTIVIAHRPTTIQNADTIYVLEEGKAVRQQGRTLLSQHI